MFEQFSKFYGDLNLPGVILFWSVIAFVFFLVFAVILLLLTNKKLTDELNKLKKDPKESALPEAPKTPAIEPIKAAVDTPKKDEPVLEKTEVLPETATEKTSDSSSVYKEIRIASSSKLNEEKSEEDKKYPVTEEIIPETKEEKKETPKFFFEEPVLEETKPNIEETQVTIKPLRTFGFNTSDNDFKEEKLSETKKLYQKDAFKDLTPMEQTSPIALGRTSAKDIMNFDYTGKMEPIEISNFEEEMKEAKEETDTSIDEIADKLTDLDKTMPIDLNEYEKKQEEEAIISLEELTSKNKPEEPVKEEKKPVEEPVELDSDSDNDFLKELKQFRNNL